MNNSMNHFVYMNRYEPFSHTIREKKNTKVINGKSVHNRSLFIKWFIALVKSILKKIYAGGYSVLPRHLLCTGYIVHFLPREKEKIDVLSDVMDSEKKTTMKDKKREESVILRHGVYAQRDKVPAQVKREANLLRDRIIEDIASTEDKLSGAELMLLDRTINIYGVIRMIEIYVAKHGAFDEKGNMRSILTQVYLAYNNTLRLNLRELKIRRKVEDYLTPAELIKELEENDK